MRPLLRGLTAYQLCFPHGVYMSHTCKEHLLQAVLAFAQWRMKKLDHKVSRWRLDAASNTVALLWDCAKGH